MVLFTRGNIHAPRYILNLWKSIDNSFDPVRTGNKDQDALKNNTPLFKNLYKKYFRLRRQFF